MMYKAFKKRLLRNMRDSIAWLGLPLLTFCAGRLSYPTASTWGARIGRLACVVARKQRRRSMENLSQVFGLGDSDPLLRQMVRGLFENFCRSGLECVSYNRLPDDQKRRYVRIVGRELLDEALAQKRGVIALTAHLGNFLILMTRLAVEGYEVDLLVRSMKDKRLEGALNALRRDFGFNSIYVTSRTKSVRESLRALKANHILVILGDQRQRHNGVEVEFLGLPTTTARGPVSLALATGAPVVPMFMVRNPDGISHTLYVERPLDMVKTGSKERDTIENAQRYTNVIQRYVERYPTQWIWNYRRWKRAKQALVV